MRAYFFRLLHILISRYAIATALLSLIAAGYLGWYGVEHMSLITDQDRLLSEDLPYHKRYLDFLKRFGDLEFLYILVEGPDKETMKAFAHALDERLSQSPDVREIIYHFPTGWMKDYALHYVPAEDLSKLESELSAHRGDIRELYNTRSIDEALQAVYRGLDGGLSSLPAGDANSASPGAEEDLDLLIDALGGRYADPFGPLKELDDEIEKELPSEDEYLWSNDGKSMLMLVMPAKDYSTLSVIEEPLRRIRADIALTAQDFNGRVTAGLTGRPALQADEMRTTNNDMKTSSLIALAGVAVLFIVFFRELGRPFLAMLALMIAMGWTYGVVAMTLGHLNLLSTVFALVLIGLGIDFGIHFIHRYQEELGSTGDPSQAALNSLQHAGSGIITGAVTSSVAFLLAQLTDFLGLAELGYVAGIGILLCLTAMLVTLPAFLILYDARYKGHLIQPVHLTGLRHGSRHPRTLSVIVFILTLAAIPEAMHVRFDDNLLKLQADNLESVEYEHKLMNDSQYSTWYAAFQKHSVDEVRELVSQLKQDPTVAGTESIASVLPEETAESLRLLAEIKDHLAPALETPPAPYIPNPGLALSLRDRISSMLLQVQRMSEPSAQPPSMDQISPEQLAALSPEQLEQLKAMQSGQGNEQAQAKPPSLSESQQKSLDRLNQLADLLSGSEGEVRERLAAANRALFETPRERLAKVANWAATPSPEPNVLPKEYQELYVGKDQSLLVMAYPKENIWETAPMERFVSAMRSHDPQVTGTPIQVYESSNLMRESFTRIAWMSLVAVAVLVYLDFLSLTALFFVMTPLIMGVLWMVSIMGMFGLHLNLANFFAIPILIGIGVDNAVHLYHRYQEDGDVERAIYTTGTTLTLTTLTTGVGFGSLIFASHKGLASFGALMALGTATCWFACVIFLPAMIKVFSRTKSGGKYSLDSVS